MTFPLLPGCLKVSLRRLYFKTKPQKAIQWSLPLRPPVHPAKYGLNLKVVLKWRELYIENTRMMSLMASLKMEGILK